MLYLIMSFTFFLFFFFYPSVLFKQYSPEFLRIWMVHQKLYSGQESNEENGYEIFRYVFWILLAWEPEAAEVRGPAFETGYAIREGSPFISKYISLLRNAKDGGQKEEQFGTSENSLSLQKTEGWPSLGVTHKTLSWLTICEKSLA